MTHAEYPTGLVTFVFTDIEGYSNYERQYAEAFEPLLLEHNALLRELITSHGGVELRPIGDAFFIAFDKPSDAVRFAVASQHALRERSWSITHNGETTPLEIRVRMGMHSGEARLIFHPDGRADYLGTHVNMAARVMGAGHGGQILVSEATRVVAQSLLPPDIGFLDLGLQRLKGTGEERLWQICHKGLLQEFPPIGAMQPEKHNLPLPLTPFVGREKEVREWTELLRQPGTRLLTISGFGGMGKTRISQQIAEECFDEFEHGVWWVPLENATNADEMTQRIAEQLVKNLKPQPSVREQLWDFHRDRDLLLVLDNLEQIERNDVAQVLMGLLQAGPRIKILATSRRSLEIAPERHVELQPFSAREAEVLFVERAKARKANFVLDDSNAADVAAICRKLEGVPLAIEIAASRITLMAPRQMLPRLDAQLKALVARDPTLRPRQQALRGAVEWSYNLLGEDAKTLFAQLAVFAGGFYLEAAIGVVCREDEEGCTAFDEYAVEESLLELRNHSLLRARSDEATGLERLLMLEAVREYAAEKLEDQSVRRRHAEYYCQWANEQIEHLRSREEAEVIAAEEIEFDNLRAALDWAEKNDAGLCARLALAINPPLHLRGHWEEAGVCLQKGWNAVQMLENNEETLGLRASLRHHQASLMQDVGDYTGAREAALQSLELYRQASDDLGAANTLNLLAVLANETRDYAGAREFCEQALKLWPATHHVGRGKALHNLGLAAQGENNIPEARRFYEETLPLRRMAGDERGLAITLGNLGTLAQDEGELAVARRYYAESLQLWRKLGQPIYTAFALNNLGDLLCIEGDALSALVLLIHAERIFLDLKSPYASEPARLMNELRARIGEEEYSRLKAEAEGVAWEDVV